LIREEKELGEIRIVSMRKGKGEIEEARQGEECGILFSPQLDFKIGDDILSVRKAISSKL
jgi:translation initiation factor IF-2